MSRMLGRYELLEQLGEGGMGAVYLARLTGAAGFEKLCIVKTVLPSIAKDAEFVSRFLHEGRVLTQLSHGNIAQVLDLNEAEGTLFLALEYVAGVDLSRLHDQVRAAQEFMPLPIVVALLAQAAEGLGAAHRKAALDGSPLQIVHRDVSPHNIMVSYEGEVKVIDFGIAKSEARSRHTAQASVLGKLGYMAPEQASGEPLDHRADQYALGIIGWELLSNQSFVRRGTLTEMVAAMAAPKRQPLVPLRAEVPESLEAVIQRALAVRPHERFATTDEFAQALMAELLKLGAPPTKPQLGQYVRSRCAQEFAATRQLLTRVSTQRSPPPGEVPHAADVFAETTVRPLPTVAHVAHGGGPPLATGQPTMNLRPPVPTDTETAASGHAPVQASTQVLASPPHPLAIDQTLQPVGTVVSTPAVTPLDRPAPAKAPPPAPLPMPVSDRPLTTGEIRAAVPSRQPLVIGIAAAVVGVLAIAVFFVSSGGEEKQAPQPVEVSPRPAPVVDAGAVADAVVDAGAVAEVVIDAGLVPVVAPPPPVEEQPSLRLNGRRTGTSWILANGNRTTWTSCRMTLPGQRVADVGTMPKGGSREVPFARFKVDPSALVLDKQARLDCAEGFGVLKAP